MAAILLTSAEWFAKADALEAKGRVRAAAQARAMGESIAVAEEDERETWDHADYLADLAAERRNEMWFEERGGRFTDPRGE